MSGRKSFPLAATQFVSAFDKLKKHNVPRLKKKLKKIPSIGRALRNR